MISLAWLWPTMANPAHACSCGFVTGLLATYPVASTDNLPANARFIAMYGQVEFQEIPTTLLVDGLEVPVVAEVLFEHQGVIAVAVTPESPLPAGSLVEFAGANYEIGDGSEDLLSPDEISLSGLNRAKKSGTWGGGGDCSPWDFVEFSVNGLDDNDITYMEVELEQDGEINVIPFLTTANFLSVGYSLCGGNAALVPTERVCLRARQVDSAGNASAWSNPKCSGRGCACSSGPFDVDFGTGFGLLALHTFRRRTRAGLKLRVGAPNAA